MNALLRSTFLTMLLLLFSSLSFAEAVWIDVRSPEEHAQDAIKGDINIPHTQIAEKISTVTTDKNAEIHVYCRSGRRSEAAKTTLESLGYKRVINEGGIEDARKKHP